MIKCFIIKEFGEEMEIILHLEGNCIETEVEKKYKDLAESLLKEEDEEKEKKLDFVKEFLENSDFNKLRSAGFDGNEEMFVKITKKDDDFIVKETDKK